MSKQELQWKVREAESQQEQLYKEIEKLKRKLAIFKTDKSKIEQEKERQYVLRKYRIKQIDLIRHRVAGKAITSVVENYDYMYGEENWGRTRNEFDSIIDGITQNIRLANERIVELKMQIQSLESQIIGWNGEIAELERMEREEEERRAREELEAERKGAKR